jgi:hypothetical protein
MPKDPNVISLEERRRAGTTPPRRVRPGEPAEGAVVGDAGTSGALARGAAADARPVPGRLIWLYCRACRTLEYTEQELPGGRVHNVCGTHVHEAAVELDLRAEATVARTNLERLELLQSVLDAQRRRFEEYLRRVNLAAGRPLEPYEQGQGAAATLPVAGVDALGLLVSRFFDDPARHFPEPAAPDGDTSQTADIAPPGAKQD